MRASRRRVVVVVVLVAALAFACNALTGADDLRLAAPCEGAGCVDAAPAVDAPVGPPPTCACAPAAPDGWTGPLAVAERGAGDGEACGGGLVTALEAGVPTAGSAGCTPCGCGAPSVTCGVTIRYHDTTACSLTTVCDTVALVGTACAGVGSCGAGGGGARIFTTTLDAGCSPDGGAPRPVEWERAFVGCAFAAPPPPSAGCAGGQACSPGLAGARTCITRAGDESCPSGPYQSRTLLHADVVDTRACAPCTCAPPSTACANVEVTSYALSNCGASGGTAVAYSSVTCNAVNTGSDIDSARVTAGPSDAGPCAPSGGGLLDGGVTPSQPTTLCCLP